MKNCVELNREVADHQFQAWMSDVHSVFCPAGVQVGGAVDVRYPSEDAEQFGLYVGPAIFGKVEGIGFWQSVRIKLDDRSGTSYVKACEDNTINAQCFNYRVKGGDQQLYVAKLGKAFMEIDESSTPGNIQTWNCKEGHDCKGTCTVYYKHKNEKFKCFRGNDMYQKIKFMNIPKGKRVTYKTTEAISGIEITHGPYTGPLTLSPDSSWPINTIKVSDLPKNTHILKICTKFDLKGKCAEIDIIPKEINKKKDIVKMNNIDFVRFGNELIQKDAVSSLQISDGYEVFLSVGRKMNEKTIISKEIGPFSGTVNLAPIVDDSNKYRIIKREIRIIEKIRIYSEKCEEILP